MDLPISLKAKVIAMEVLTQFLQTFSFTVQESPLQNLSQTVFSPQVNIRDFSLASFQFVFTSRPKLEKLKIR
jgi:hypothetical protein